MNEHDKAVSHNGDDKLSNGAKACYESAIRIISRRDHSEHELRQKLEVRHFERHVIDEVLTLFLRNKWLDDIRFAQGIVRYRAERGYGPYYIRKAIMAKGVSAEIAHDVVDVHDNRWDQNALEHVRAYVTGKKSMSFSTASDDAGNRNNDDWFLLNQKLSARLQRRGFSSETIISALNRIREEQEEYVNE